MNSSLHNITAHFIALHYNAVFQVSNQNSTRHRTTLKNNTKQLNAEQLIGSKHLMMQCRTKQSIAKQGRTTQHTEAQIMHRKML